MKNIRNDTGYQQAFYTSQITNGKRVLKLNWLGITNSPGRPIGYVEYFDIWYDNIKDLTTLKNELTHKKISV